MPTYSYRCTACENAFDTVQSFADEALTECPSCGGRLRKVFAAVGVSFNGSGFYRNDSKPARKAESASSPSSSSSGSSTESSSSSSSTSPSTSTSTSTSTSKEG